MSSNKLAGRAAQDGPQHVLVTGGSGFIGRHLARALLSAGNRLSCVARRGSGRPPELQAPGVTWIEIDDIATHADWAALLHGVDAVVHLAARVHVMRETVADPLAAFRRVNVVATHRLAEAAVAARVRRFLYISTIKVNGERTLGRPFHADDPPAASDPYARSKLEAEQGLWRLAANAATEFVVLRPPLVYGPGVKGNFTRLVRLVRRGWPLPLGGIENRRSMVAVDNLVDCIGACLAHPAAAGQVFLVSDGADWSTPELVAAIAAALGRPARLFPLPARLLRGLAALSGRRALLDRLSDSLQVDIDKNRELLQWVPVVPPALAVRRAVQAIIVADDHG